MLELAVFIVGYVYRILGSTKNGIFYRNFTEYPTHARTVMPRPFFLSPAKNGLGNKANQLPYNNPFLTPPENRGS